MADPVQKNLMLVIDGVRYRREDAVRLGLIKGTAKEKKAPAAEEGDGNGGTVPGDAGGPGGADEPASVEPKAPPRARPRK